MLQIWLEPGLVHLKQSWPQALPTEKQPSTAVVPPKVGSDVPFLLSRMITAVYCIACCHPTWSRHHQAISRAVFWFFLSLNIFWFLFGSLLNLVSFSFGRVAGACQQNPEKSLPAMHPFQVIKVHNHRPGDIPRKVTVVGPWVKDNRWDSVVRASVFQNFTTRVTLVAWIVAFSLY